MNIKRSELAGTFFTSGQLPADSRPKILFFGRSNVGKSSLINTLMEHRLAKTSSTPGKTLSINYYAVGWSHQGAPLAGRLLFVDLPGYGFARAPKSEVERVRRLIADFLRGVQNVRLALLLIDSRRGFLTPDLEVLARIIEKKFPILTILTKSDKLSLSEQNNLLAHFKKKFGLHVIFFSIKSPKGKNEIWQQIMEAVKE